MQKHHLEQIFDGKQMIAIIIYADYEADGIEFFTPHDFSQQLACMRRPKGYRIPAHIHKPISRQVSNTQETLFVRSGKVAVNFYREDRTFLDSRNLGSGDVILLVSGGHDFQMLEDSQIIEVKQGPYTGDQDKERFEVE